jgi:hypothetical protein
VAEAQIDCGSYSGFRLCATTQFFDRVKIIQNEVTAVRRTVKLAGFTMSIPSILGQQGECQFLAFDKLPILVALNRSRLDFSPRLEGFSSDWASYQRFLRPTAHPHFPLPRPVEDFPNQDLPNRDGVAASFH